MFVYLIIIYLILLNLSFLTKRKKSRLFLATKLQFLQSVIIVIFFIFYFVFFIRLMNLFRQTQILDLKYFFFNFDIKIIILLAILFFCSRRNFMFCVKINCYRLHYYYMNIDVAPKYNMFFNTYFNHFVYHAYPIMYFINIMATTVMYSFIVIDLIFNGLVLNNCLILLPWYSIFKMFYNFIKYFELEHHALYDYYVRKHNHILCLLEQNKITRYASDLTEVEEIYLNYERKIIREM